MPVYSMQWDWEQEHPREEKEELQRQLEEEINACTEVRSCYRNGIKKFLMESGVWHISEMDYPLREDYGEYLKHEAVAVSHNEYLKGFDRIKQHSIREQTATFAGQRKHRIKYENRTLFLPYHPDQELVKRLEKTRNKKLLVWDFSLPGSEKMKKQVFQVLHCVLETNGNMRDLTDQILHPLQRFYDFCLTAGIRDLEKIELEHVQAFRSVLEMRDIRPRYNMAVVDFCRRTLFMRAEEVHWDANIWYLERFHFAEGRMNPSRPVGSISFMEVTHPKNREYLQKYMRYGLGVTHLAISKIRTDFLYVRNFMEVVGRKGLDVCECRPEDMADYFIRQQGIGYAAKSFNAQVLGILHFYNFLLARGHIRKVPFYPQYYMQKVAGVHHDRSVDQDVCMEIIRKLRYFPEHLRLMFLHLWSTGIRGSEVCTLKGDAYYLRGNDTWMKAYQVKMKVYKRIPIPEALYRLMQAYIKKNLIGPDEYVFQNRRGGAYQYETFRSQMMGECRKKQVKGGEYTFRSHDYRHGLATMFYDKGVSIQGIRDYLGHEYEEMTKQYVDYMPRRIAEANEAYFKEPGNSLAAALKEGGSDGR